MHKGALVAVGSAKMSDYQIQIWCSHCRNTDKTMAEPETSFTDTTVLATTGMPCQACHLVRSK